MYKFTYILLLLALSIVPVKTLFAAPKSTLHIPIYDSPVNLDPAQPQDSYSIWVSRQINCQLMRAADAYPILEAANSVKYITPWKIAITLKRGLTFSNNKPVTAPDVVASYHYLEKHQNYLSNISYWIEKIYAISATKIIVELHNPASEFVQILALHDLPIYQKDFLTQAEKNPALWNFPVTCGGYKVIKNNSHELSLAPRFNQHPIVFEKTNDTPIKKSDYKNFDIIDGYFVGTESPTNGFRKIQVFAPYQMFLGLNLSNPRWQNKKRRCEFLNRLNPDEVLKSYGDSAQKANDLFPTGVIGYRAHYQFAEEMRDNYPETNRKIKFDSFHLALLKISVPEKYEAGYIQMVKDALDTKNFSTIQIAKTRDYTKPNYDALIIGFRSDALEGYDFLVLFSKNGKNFTRFYNRTISERLLNSQDLNNNEDKARQYQRIEDIIRGECITTPIVTIPMQTFFVKDSLSTPNISKAQLDFYYLGDIS